LAVVLAVAGCGDSKFSYAPVAGQVLLDGKPVPNARVVFMPRTTREDGEAGPYSNGTTDDEGRFTLATVESDSKSGAVVGPHRVIVSTRQAHVEPNDPDIEIIDSPETIPRPYNHYRLTPLTFEVPPKGTTSADFKLDSKKKR
jgi:hypothetical protein